MHLHHGTTSLMASLVSGSKEALIEQIRTLSPLVDQGVLMGIHLEGPWISTLHCGAHDVAQLRAPDPTEVGELLAVGGSPHQDGDDRAGLPGCNSGHSPDRSSGCDCRDRSYRC